MNYYGNISRLRYFKAVCECGTITKAAEILNISQPSLTASIKELEKELGIALFHRSKNTLHLTEHGGLVLKKTNRMLECLDKYYREILEYGDFAEREITVGVPPILGTIIIPKIFDKATERFVDLDFRLHECVTSEALTLIDNNIISVAMLIHNDIPNEYNFEVIHESEIYYWANKNHPLAKRTFVTGKDVCQYPLVMLTSDSYHYGAIVERFKREDAVPNIKLFSKQMITISKVIENNSMATATYKDISLPKDSFVGIPFSPPINIKLAVVWGKNDFVTPAQKRVIKFLKDIDWVDA